MSRNSEIDRQQLGATVLNLSGQGLSSAKISSKMPQLSKQQIDRYVQKHKPLSPAVSPVNNMRELLVAAIQGLPDKRDTHTTDKEYYGRFEINTKNVFDKYYSIARGGVNGQVSRAFINLALKMTNGITVVGDEAAQKSIDTAMDSIKFKSLAQDVARSLCEMGTVVVSLKDTKGNLVIPKINPINYITLLTVNETIGSITDNLLIHGDIDRVVHDEGGNSEIVYAREDVALFQLWNGANYFIDIQGRNTFGIWGASMIPSIETPLKSLMNASYYYDEFIKRYGMGRLHIDMRLLSDLYKDSKISKDNADTAQESEAAAFQNIKANEDIITVGEDVKMLDVQNAFDITTFFEFKEKQISRALLQSDISQGDVGSKWTDSGGEVSRQQLMDLQSLRDTFFDTMYSEVVVPYLELAEISTEGVSIYAEPLSHISVAHRDLIEMRELGEIARSELRHRTGFPDELPEA